MKMHNLRLLKKTDAPGNGPHPAEQSDKRYDLGRKNTFLFPRQVEQFDYFATVPANKQGKKSILQNQVNVSSPASKKSVLLWYGFLAAAILFITYRFLVVAAIHH